MMLIAYILDMAILSYVIRRMIIETVMGIFTTAIVTRITRKIPGNRGKGLVETLITHISIRRRSGRCGGWCLSEIGFLSLKYK